MKLYVLVSEPWDIYEEDYSYDYLAKVHAVFTDEDEAERARHDVQAVDAPEGVRFDA